METIFPLLFVEQKAGWSAIQGSLPYVSKNSRRWPTCHRIPP
jgi:hypothetical protein